MRNKVDGSSIENQMLDFDRYIRTKEEKEEAISVLVLLPSESTILVHQIESEEIQIRF